MSQSNDTIFDPVTRVIHWVVAIGVITNLYVIERGAYAHRLIGYTLAGAIVLRIVWGFLGGHHSRFVNFPLGPSHMIRFVKGEVTRKPVDYAGHNPAASWTYIGVWGVILSLGVTGWMQGSDQFGSEEWVYDAHTYLTWALQGLIAAHIAGMSKDAFEFRRKTWMGMINGRRDPI